MQLAYPIKAILMYLALLFCPPDAEKIVVDGFPGSGRIELVRNGQTWRSEGNSIYLEQGALVVEGSHGKESIRLGEFIKVPENYDWNKNPSFALGDSTTLEKTPAGFTFRRNSGSGEGNGVYQITHGKASSGGRINVLGEVVKQGSHEIPPGGSVLDVLAAAGGATAGADLTKVSVIRGPAGSVPKVAVHDMAAALAGNGINPPVESGDTVYVPLNDPKLGSAEVAALAEKWLALIDAGQFARSWESAAESFRSAIAVGAWTASLDANRMPLGAVKSRKVRKIEKATMLPGAPDGDYFVMQFETSFAAKETAIETVTFMLEKDGTWKAAGYFIK